MEIGESKRKRRNCKNTKFYVQFYVLSSVMTEGDSLSHRLQSVA